MDRAAIRSYVDRTEALLEQSTPSTVSQTLTWVVEPFLETLGWNVRSTDCEHGSSIAGTHLEYVCSIEKTPALFVAVDAYPRSLSETRERDLRSCMQTTGVNRAIYTNGRRFVLLANESDGDRFSCELAELPEAVGACRHVSRAELRHRFDRMEPGLAARRLRIDREIVEASIVEELVTRAGDSYRPEFHEATQRFLHSILSSLETSEDEDFSGHADRSAGTESNQSSMDNRDSQAVADRNRPPTSGDEDRLDYSALSAADNPDVPTAESSGRDETGLESAGERQQATRQDRSPDTPEFSPRSDFEDGTYVVRFFDERGSIGAIGHSCPDGAMVHAAEYLLERGLSGVELPWSPDDGNTALNDEPRLETGSKMAHYALLSGDLVLNIAGSLDELESRTEALTDRAGLRAMFTGDWPSGV